MKVAIIDYGAGNIQSVKFALERLGALPRVTNSPDELAQCDRVIFPGVGEASSAMRNIRSAGLEETILSLDRPFLGICLGMQLMCRSSEEGETPGLGIFPMEVRKFTREHETSGYKIPHMGWNQLDHRGPGLLNDVPSGSHVYFVHSYYVPLSEYTIAHTDYMMPFSACLQKENFLACQFHPEKSGRVGETILKNFLWG